MYTAGFALFAQKWFELPTEHIVDSCCRHKYIVILINELAKEQLLQLTKPWMFLCTSQHLHFGLQVTITEILSSIRELQLLNL